MWNTSFSKTRNFQSHSSPYKKRDRDGIHENTSIGLVFNEGYRIPKSNDLSRPFHAIWFSKESDTDASYNYKYLGTF